MNSLSGNHNSSSTQVDSRNNGAQPNKSDKVSLNSIQKDIKNQKSVKKFERQMMNGDPTEGSTQVDPKSNKRSSDDSKEASGNNSSKEKEEDSKGEDSKEHITKNSKQS